MPISPNSFQKCQAISFYAKGQELHLGCYLLKTQPLSLQPKKGQMFQHAELTGSSLHLP